MFIEQNRSVQTRQCFLDAMVSLLGEKPFEAISVADIAKGAGRAVGSFYTKFKDKEEILDALGAAYEKERREMRDTGLAPAKWLGATLRARVDGVARITVNEFRTRRGLFIAIETQLRLRMARGETDIGGMTRLYDIVASLLSDAKSEITHKDTERAARFAFLLLTSLCSKAILYPTDSHPATLAMSDKEIAKRGADAMFAYLTTGDDR
jgi:AcrR family transcriptional regulator